jgi:hypothetical protein
MTAELAPMADSEFFLIKKRGPEIFWVLFDIIMNIL